MDATLDTKRRRSPLKDWPRLVPGQSLKEGLVALWDDVAPYVLFAPVMVAMAVMEWLASIRHLPRQPWLYSALAVVAVGAAAFRIWQVRARMLRLMLGRDGERVVGQLLEKLRTSNGAEVFHDVPGDGFKVDHVVLCRKGFFAIDTRTHSRPEGRDATITLTTQGLLIDGESPDADPIRQAQVNAGWLSHFLEESTGQPFAVRGVVLFPGWYVERMTTVWRCDLRQPWVLEPKALADLIAREPIRFSDGDVKLAAHHLGRYVRIVVPAQPGYDRVHQDA